MITFYIFLLVMAAVGCRWVFGYWPWNVYE